MHAWKYKDCVLVAQRSDAPFFNGFVIASLFSVVLVLVLVLVCVSMSMRCRDSLSDAAAMVRLFVFVV